MDRRVAVATTIVATLSPATALAVGLKVDAEALPSGLVAALRAGTVDLTSPAVTVEPRRWLDSLMLGHLLVR